MFYVLYSPSKKQYLDEDGSYCDFVNAERFGCKAGRLMLDKIEENAKSYCIDARIVGPCEEGEEP